MQCHTKRTMRRIVRGSTFDVQVDFGESSWYLGEEWMNDNLKIVSCLFGESVHWSRQRYAAQSS